MRTQALLPAALAVLLAVAAPVSAQVPIEYGPGTQLLSRTDLQALLEQYEAAIGSPAYSGSIKASARASAARIRTRLERGDFQPGDRIVLSIQGEVDLPDTIPVETGPQISLPLFGQITLYGVLRSEVEDHLTEEIGRFIRDPVVRAEGLMRLSVQGAVGTPGFYVVPADMLVSEALMMAGGPGPLANLDNLRIERGGNRLLQGAEMQDALQSGRTLDQLSLQAGDQIFLPEDAAGPWPTIGRYAAIITSALVLGVRIF